MRKGTKLPPIKPGDILYNHYMHPLEINKNQLANGLRVSATRVAEIIRGDRVITPETAIRLGVFFGTTAKFWLDLQANYDLQVAEERVRPIVERDVQPFDMAAKAC